MTTQSIGEEGFRWFVGIVEKIDGDPQLLGRVKVRILHEQDEGVRTEDMPWAHTMLPTTSESVEGVGDTPGLSVGSRVVGFFVDGGEKQIPMIMGSFPIVTNNDKNKHSLSWLARGKNTIKKVFAPFEPKSAYKAKYPWNRVIQTKSGHVIEMDDTPGSERLHVYHKSGSYIEINEKGRIVIKSADESYDITNNNKTIYSGNDINLIAENNIKLAAKKGVVIGAPGGLTMTKGSIFTEGAIGSKVGATGTFTTPTGQRVSVINGIVASIDPSN